MAKTIHASDEYQTFQYDAQNRLVKVTDYYNNQVDEEFTYDYSESQIIRKIYEEGELLETLTYQTANGRVASSTVTEQDSVTDVFTDSTGNTTTTTSISTAVRTTVYEHNAEGLLTKRLETNVFTRAGVPTMTNRDTTSYTYQNGNLVTEVYSSPSGRSTTTYEYYTDKKNSLLSWGDDDWFLVSKPNKNPVKKITYVGDQQTEAYSFVYLYNAEGLILKETVTQTSGAQQQSPESTDFEYNCK